LCYLPFTIVSVLKSSPITYSGLPEVLGALWYSYLHPLLGADEVGG
jgi:hypothetical protein